MSLDLFLITGRCSLTGKAFELLSNKRTLDYAVMCKSGAELNCSEIIEKRLKTVLEGSWGLLGFPISPGKSAENSSLFPNALGT